MGYSDLTGSHFFYIRTIFIFQAECVLMYMPGGGGGGTWVTFCWVCAAGLSEPLFHCILFCG